MIKHNKTYKLNDRQSSYLLLLNRDFIITNNNYSEVMLLTHELKFVRTIQLPKKDFICFYAYKEKKGNHFLFYEDEGEMFALLDIAMENTRLIRDNILKTISIEHSYVWIDSTFTALTYSYYPNNPGILSADILTKDVTLIPFEDRFNKTPQLAHYLETEEKHKAWPISCNQEYMVLGNFSETSIISIIDVHGTTVQTACIKKELEEELARLHKKNPIAKQLAERFPHDIEYQNGWILLIWEGKVVLIDPNDQRTSILMEHLECNVRGKFIAADASSAKFVILVQDHGGTKGAELRLYEVTTSNCIVIS